MNLYKTIKEHQLQARIEKNKLVVDLLSVVLAEADSQLISRKEESEQHQIMFSILQKYEKQALKNIQSLSGKMDTSLYENELKIIQAYLPQKLNSAQISEIISDHLRYSSYPDVMKFFSQNYKGLFDASEVKRIHSQISTDMVNSSFTA